MSHQKLKQAEGIAIYHDSIRAKIGVWAKKIKAEGSNSHNASRTRMFYMVCTDIEAGERTRVKTSAKSKYMDAVIHTAMYKLEKGRARAFPKRTEHKDIRYSYEIQICVAWFLPENGKSRAPVDQMKEHTMILCTLTSEDDDLEAFSPWDGGEVYQLKKSRMNRIAERAKRKRLEKEIEEIYPEDDDEVDNSVRDAIVSQPSIHDAQRKWLEAQNAKKQAPTPSTTGTRQSWPKEPPRHTKL